MQQIEMANLGRNFGLQQSSVINKTPNENNYEILEVEG